MAILVDEYYRWTTRTPWTIRCGLIVEVDDGPSHDGVSVNAAAPHRPSEGDDGPSTHGGGSGNAAASHRPFEGDAGPSTHEDPAAPHRTTAADPPLEEGEWPSASVSTSGVPSEGSGGATAKGFKGRTTNVSRPAKFQVVGGKGKKATGKGTRSNK
nr:hypothetical protein CFP56_16057 [Quercus suber]